MNLLIIQVSFTAMPLYMYICLENRDYGRKGCAALTMRHPSIRKSWH
jgi:hypothetical protein